MTEPCEWLPLGTSVDPDDMERRLRTIGLDPDVRQNLARSIPRAVGVLLYGSWARGQARPTSDVDLLVLDGASFVPHGWDRISITHYSTEQLRQADRTLFGMHLARDGVIVHDSNGELARLLSALSPPDALQLLDRVHRFTAALDVGKDDEARYIEGLCKLARYLLRTAIYARALRDGRPSFSLVDLAEINSQPELPVILSSHENVYPEPSQEVLADLRNRLSEEFGQLAENPYGSLEALIVGSWDEDPDLSNLATLAISSGDDLPYEELPKVVL